MATSVNKKIDSKRLCRVLYWSYSQKKYVFSPSSNLFSLGLIKQIWASRPERTVQVIFPL